MAAAVKRLPQIWQFGIAGSPTSSALEVGCSKVPTTGNSLVDERLDFGNPPSVSQ